MGGSEWEGYDCGDGVVEGCDSVANRTADDIN